MNRLPLWVLLCTLLATFIFTTAISIDAVETALTNRLRHSDREVAHAMAIGLSRQQARIEDAQSLIDAHFALGNYQRIRLIDPTGRAIYVRERQNPPVESGLNDNRLFWLWTLKPSEQLPPATAPVKDSALGISHVSVQSVLTFDHQSSERWLLRLAAIVSLLAAVSSLILILTMRRRQQGLKSLEQSVDGLLDIERGTVPAPADPELQELHSAVVRLSEQIRQRTHKTIEQVEQLNRLRRTDPATGLLNRDAFATRLAQICGSLPPQQTAHILLVRVLNLPALNAAQGRHRVDELLGQLGRLLGQLLETSDNSVCGRITGTDIALLCDASPEAQAALKMEIRSVLSQTALQTNLDDIAFMRDERPADILRRCETNQALATVQHVESLGQRDVWCERLGWALTQHHFYLQGFRVATRSGEPFHQEYYLRLPERKSGVVYSGGTLMAWAEHLNLAAEIDVEVINLALSMAANQTERVCINLTAAALVDPQRRAALIRDLEQSPRYVNRIDVEVTEETAFSHPERLHAFAEQVRPLGVRVGVDRLDEYAAELIRLQGMGIRYVKVAAALTSELLDAQRGRERSRLLSELVHSAHVLAIDILAENISDTTLVQALFDIGFDGVSGPAVS